MQALDSGQFLIGYCYLWQILICLYGQFTKCRRIKRRTVTYCEARMAEADPQ